MGADAAQIANEFGHMQIANILAPPASAYPGMPMAPMSPGGSVYKGVAAANELIEQARLKAIEVTQQDPATRVSFAEVQTLKNRILTPKASPVKASPTPR